MATEFHKTPGFSVVLIAFSQEFGARHLPKERLMEKTKHQENQEPSIQAMVWYKEEHWDALIKLFADSHLLPKKYSDWLQKAEEMVKKVESSGDVVMKVFIDPDTFPAWCKEKGKEMDMHARTELAIEVATQQNFGPKV